MYFPELLSIEYQRAKLDGTESLDENMTADFSNLTQASEKICISQIEQATTLEIDEKGARGAAYTDMVLLGAASNESEDEMDFVLDRPFLFILYSNDGAILFEGIVRDIE